MIDVSNIARPQPYYKEVFFKEILSHSPASVLDVGCGNGALLVRLKEEGVAVAGLEIDAAIVQELSSSELNVTAGVGEDMPFDDASFDFVVSEFTAHHFEDFELFVTEALRVSRKGVLVLDQWYDLTVPESALADRFDRWCKVVDQQAGEIHHPSFSAGELVSVFHKEGGGALHIGTQTLLLMKRVADAKIEEWISPQLTKVHLNEQQVQELGMIRQEVQKIGMNDDGAIIVTVLK